jgi:hypothetical protein
MFKRCPNCDYQWQERRQFLEDPGLRLLGYQVNYKKLTAGIFLFNHACRGTLAIAATDFSDLYDGPVFETCATGSALCPGHCLHEDDLEPCPAECECAFVRQILHIVDTWPKLPTNDRRSVLGSI